MKVFCIAAVAMIASFGLVESSSAERGGWGVPPGDYMNARAGLVFTGGKYRACYRFTFRLREDSDGIFPGAETVEIEIPGELNPDGTEGSAFVISVPIGGFDRLWTSPDGSNHAFAFNPPGLKASQQHESFVFDFVDTNGKFSYPDPSARGVKLFWGLITQHAKSDGITMQIRFHMNESRPKEFHWIDGRRRNLMKPNLMELLFGSPILRIGNDEWQSTLRYPNSSPPYDSDGRISVWYEDWSCTNFFQATWYD